MNIVQVARRYTVVFAVISATVACADTGPSQTAKLPPGYPTANGPGEIFQPGEPRAAAEIAQTIKAALTRRAKGRAERGHSRPYVRDAHPKAHGCVKANVRIESGLDPVLAHGVFGKSAKSYCAWVRFSNSNEDPDRSDAQRDGRGMAIKLLGVEGKTLLEEHRDAGTQDFIMISHPVFFIDKAKDYVTVIDRVNSESTFDKLLLPFTLGIQGTWNAFQITSLKNANPFDARYWSMVPYQLGGGGAAKATKFMSQPCGYEKFSDQKKEKLTSPDIPDNAGKNFLRAALKSRLQNTQPCMELRVQMRGRDMDVEDAKTEWRASLGWWDKLLGREASPFTTVATLTFPKGQAFDTAPQNNACEDMSYTPWHALPEHRPLGALNRMRKVIYREISEFRRTNNKAPREEPPAFHLNQCVNGEWQG